MTGKHLSYEEREAEARRIADQLLKGGGSGMENPAFCARDLGFPDHTKIHDAAKEIIALYAARVVVYYGMHGTETEA